MKEKYVDEVLLAEFPPGSKEKIPAVFKGHRNRVAIGNAIAQSCP
jgi:hypothetical protein